MKNPSLNEKLHQNKGKENTHTILTLHLKIQPSRIKSKGMSLKAVSRDNQEDK